MEVFVVLGGVMFVGGLVALGGAGYMLRQATLAQRASERARNEQLIIVERMRDGG